MKKIETITQPTSLRTWLKLAKSAGCDDKVLEIIKSDEIFRAGNSQQIVRKISILTREELYMFSDLTSENILVKAQQFNFSYPDAELAFHIWEDLTYKKMFELGLSTILVMHRPVNINGKLYRLAIDRTGRVSPNRLTAIAERPSGCWEDWFGFAFIE